MKQYKRMTALTVAAALAALSPLQVLASPQFAHDEATWARLQDNIMEYDELQMLVEEYNPTYLNNQTTYSDNRTRRDAGEVRDKQYESAIELYDSADELRGLADDYLDMGLASAYASMIAAAVQQEQSALRTQQTADASYTDSEMDRIEHVIKQREVIIQTQGLFASYNQIKKTLTAVEKNMEYQQASHANLERRVQTQMATQTDLLKSLQALQSLQSTYTETQASLESTRQQLCLMTGWNYNDQPDIRELPLPDLSRIATMNPEADAQTALASNLSLQYNRRAYGNMQEGSSDKKNMERTIANQEETIRAGMTNLYNDVIQKQAAQQLAQSALTARTAEKASADRKYQLGMIAALEHLQAESNFANAQIDAAAADMNLQQAIETYEWALSGYMS